MSKIKNLSFGNEARDKVRIGVMKLSSAVQSTLGPCGRNVMIEREHGSPLITKDGVTVAKEIYLKDPIDVSSVSLSTLVAINSNIFPAQQIQVWAGNNPRSLRMVKKEMPVQPEKSAPTYTKGFQISFKPIKANYLKVVLIPVHKLPMWRSPKGFKGWVFVDEVFLY